MNRPLSSVQLSIARLGLEIMRLPDAAARATWLLSFHEALAIPDPSLNSYAAELIAEAEAFRRKERTRKGFLGKDGSSKDSAGKRRNPAERRGRRRIP